MLLLLDLCRICFPVHPESTFISGLLISLDIPTHVESFFQSISVVSMHEIDPYPLELCFQGPASCKTMI